MIRLVHLTLAWLVGIALGDWLWQQHLIACGTPLWIWPAAAGLGVIISARAGRLPALRLAAALGVMILLGLTRYQATPLTPCLGPTDVATYNGSDEQPATVTLTGVIDGDPDPRDRQTQYRVRAQSLLVGEEEHQVHGLVLVQGPRYPLFAYGDQVRISGKLQTPPQLDDFDYQAYLARKGVYALLRQARLERLAAGQGSRVWAALYAVRGRSAEIITQLMPAPAAGLAQGILLGIDREIPRDLYERFNLTGTSHIIVISGSNISLVVAMLASAATRLFGKRRAVWLVLSGLTVYVLLVGADPAVVRAGLMGALAVMALYLGRQSEALTSLAVAVFVMTLINPLDLWNVGLQLSSLATLGLILFSTPLQESAERFLLRILTSTRARQAIGLLNDALLVTLAANVTTLPLIVYTFHRLPVISLLTNMLILPAQPPIMLWGGGALLLGLISPLLPLARLLALVPWLCLSYTIAVVRWTSALPGASLELPHFSAAWMWASYALIFGLLWWSQQAGARRAGWLRALATQLPAKTTLLALTGALAITGLALTQMPDGRLHVTFLDIGQGDAILIETPSGNTALVDGGPAPSALFAALGEALPFWARRLDLVVSTHDDLDHLGGLVPIITRYQVGQVVVNGLEAHTPEYAQWQANLGMTGIPVLRGQAGGQIHLGDGVWLDVLSPGAQWVTGTSADSNNNSVVLRLRYGRFSVLLPGDIEAVMEEDLQRQGAWLQATVLKVPHHGSNTSSTADWLQVVHPQLAVIEVGKDNTFGHPKPEILARYRDLGIPVLRTDLSGTIEVSSDGRRFWIVSAR